MGLDVMSIYLLVVDVLCRRIHFDYDDPEGAAMYSVFMITFFATAIGFFIAMLSFKRTKHEDWDREGWQFSC